MLNTDQRYLGGGRLYFERLENGILQPKKEIGEVKDFKITSNIETTAVESFEGEIPELVDEVVVKQEFNISFTTNQVDKDTLLMALFGNLTSKTYKQGDTLPDGTTAAKDTTFNVVDAAMVDEVIGRLTFVTSAKRGRQKIAVFYRVSLQTNADILLQSREFVTLGFTGKVLKDPTITEGSPYFRVYEQA